MNFKRLLVASSVTLLCVGIASATATRVMTLGNVNHFVKDKANINYYPHLVNNYPDWASFEVNGAGSMYTVGGHHAFGNAVYGVYLSTNGLPEGGHYGPVVGEGGAADASTAPKLDLYYGRKMGDMPLGINLSLYSNSWKSKAAGDKSERSQFYFGFGVSSVFMQHLEAGLKVRTHSFVDKGSDGKDITKPKGGMKLDLNARYWHSLGEDTWMVPYFGLTNESQGYDSSSVEMSHSKMSIKLGSGFIANINANTMFVSDFGLAFGSGEEKMGSASEKTTDNQMPYYRFGFESKVNEWLVARLGAERAWTSHTADKTEEWSSSSTGLYLGAGLKKGDFLIDLSVDPGIITRGPYFLTGAGGNWATMASIRWAPSK